MAKTDNQTIENIKTSYALTGSYRATAKECNVAPNTVKNIILKQDAQEYAQYCNDKKETFIQKADRLIDKAMNKLDKALDKEDIPVNNLTTAIGTLVDKKRLISGESTENNKFEVNIKVVE